MLIDVLKVEEGFSQHSALLSDLAQREGWPSMAGGLSCDADIDRYGEDIRVRICYTGILNLQCSRCLEDFQSPCSGSTEVTIRHGEVGAVPEHELEYVYTDENSIVDVSSAIFDEIQINMSLKPLCAENCTGILIPQDRAKSEILVDPRWAALKKLKDIDQSH